MKDLTGLHLSGNKIEDITALNDLTSLSWLALNQNKINDISILSELKSLTTLYLDTNQVSDITPLIKNTGISGIVTLKSNPLSNTSFTSYLPILESREIKLTYDDTSSDIVIFKDVNLEKAIRDALVIPTELLKKEDLEKLEELKHNRYEYVNEELIEKPKEVLISDLTGIEQ